MSRKLIKVKNIDFYLSKENVEPIKKISGSLYLINKEPVDGMYKVSKFKYFIPILDKTRGYIKATDLINIDNNLEV